MKPSRGGIDETESTRRNETFYETFYETFCETFCETFNPAT